MDFLVHGHTSGHLLVATSLGVAAVATMVIDVHVITSMPPPRLLLWVMTIFVRVFYMIIVHKRSSIQMLHSGMARFVRVVEHAALQQPTLVHQESNQSYHKQS